MKPTLPIPSGRLRLAEISDLDDLLALLHGREVRRYLCDDTLLPREMVAEMLERSGDLNAQGLGLWVIERADGAFAGIAGLEPVSAGAGASPKMAGGIEPLIAIDPAHWGQGLAQEALGALIRHARETLTLPKLVGAVDQPNARSHRMMRRAGFATMGTAPGPVHEFVLYVLELRKPD